MKICSAGVRKEGIGAGHGGQARGWLALLCLWSAAFGSLHAGELSIHGFGTVGAAFLDQPDDWAYTRSINQRTSDSDFRVDLDSVVGVQLNYSPSRTVELVGQATIARFKKDTDAEDYVELAYLAWRPDPDLRLRLGRINLDAYLNSDHRDVGFTYQFIRPPVEFYSRMPTSMDGADVERMWLVDGVQWRAKIFAGHAEAGGLDMWPLFGVMLAREDDGLLLRFSALRARSRDNIAALDPLLAGLQQMQALPVPQVAADAATLEAALTTRKLHTNYLAAAAAYDGNGWLLNAEINRAWTRDSSAINFSTGYVSVGRRFGSLSAFVMQSAAIRDHGPYQTPDWITPLTPVDPVLAQQAQALAIGATTAANKTSGHQFTTSLGLRWDVAPRLALKSQLDHVRTRRDGDGLWAQASGQAASSNIIAITADFVF